MRKAVGGCDSCGRGLQCLEAAVLALCKQAVLGLMVAGRIYPGPWYKWQTQAVPSGCRQDTTCFANAMM